MRIAHGTVPLYHELLVTAEDFDARRAGPGSGRVARVPELPPDDEPSPPNPGETCSQHEERQAVLRCPRCSRPACFSCWQPVQRRCHSCVMAFPAEVAPAIPWETEGVPFWTGLGATLRQSFSPTATAPAMGHGDVRSALSFALLTWLPFAALQGVIPYTHTLLFQELEVRVAGSGGVLVALDVARAVSLGVLLGGVQLAAMGLAFASLSHAYGLSGVASAAAAWRTVLYRGFIVLLLPSLMAGGRAPSDLVANLMFFTGLFEPNVYTLVVVVAGVWLLTTLRTSARLAQGVGPGMSFVIPFMVMAVGVLVRLLAETACQPLMPELATEAPVSTPAPAEPAAPVVPPLRTPL